MEFSNFILPFMTIPQNVFCKGVLIGNHSNYVLSQNLLTGKQKHFATSSFNSTGFCSEKYEAFQGRKCDLRRTLAADEAQHCWHLSQKGKVCVTHCELTKPDSCCPTAKDKKQAGATKKEDENNVDSFIVNGARYLISVSLRDNW